MKHSNAFLLLSAASLLALAGCGDAACPAGSQRIGGQCMPVLVCPDGEERDGNECVPVDAGLDGGGDGGDPLCRGGERCQVGDGGDGDAGDGAMPDASDGSDAGPVDPLCDDLDCGTHGDCEVVRDEARCACDSGFSGELCDECEPGLGRLGGQCVPACDAEDAPDCDSDRGECDVVDDVAQCVCDRPFGGDDCGDCAEGFALQLDGSCEADCGTCGAHEFCDASLEVPDCACVAGYETSAGACEWIGDGDTGGILNGELASTTGWETRHASISGGSATFENNGMDDDCELGLLAQTITMPALDDAEPLAIAIDITTSCVESNSALCPPLLLEVGDHVTRLPVAGGGVASQTLSTCLGDAGYGESVRIRIRPGLAAGLSAPLEVPQVFSCENDEWPQIRAVRIQSASATECPIEQHIRNGTFANSAGWVLSSSSIADGALTLSSNATASAGVVFPSHETLASPALRVAYDGATPGNVRVSLGGLLLGSVLWGSGAGAQLLCIPDWAQGTGQQLRLQSASGSTSVVSEVSVVSEPLCADGSFDMGFERSSVNLNPALGSWEYGGGYAFVRSDAAHGGSRGLETSAAANAVRALMRIPEPAEGSGGVAMQLWYYKSASGLTATLSDVVPLATGSVSLTATSWVHLTTCLARAWQGQLVAVNAYTTLSGAGLVYLDDFGPVLYPSCN